LAIETVVAPVGAITPVQVPPGEEPAMLTPEGSGLLNTLDNVSGKPASFVIVYVSVTGAPMLTDVEDKVGVTLGRGAEMTVPLPPIVTAPPVKGSRQDIVRLAAEALPEAVKVVGIAVTGAGPPFSQSGYDGAVTVTVESIEPAPVARVMSLLVPSPTNVSRIIFPDCGTFGSNTMRACTRILLLWRNRFGAMALFI